MKLRYEKNIRIMNDILGYCHLIGACRFTVDFEMADTTSTIRITAQVPGLDHQRVEEADKLLNIPRQHEVEQYYWNISGEEEIDNELSLAGMMVDEATVVYQDPVLTITTIRLDAAQG